jgi:uncharacterized protein Usg
MTTKNEFDYLMIPNGMATLVMSYYFPDRPLIIAPQFIWQVRDYYPDYPRCMHFLKYWQKNINATVESILLTHELQEGHREAIVNRLPIYNS